MCDIHHVVKLHGDWRTRHIKISLATTGGPFPGETLIREFKNQTATTAPLIAIIIAKQVDADDIEGITGHYRKIWDKWKAEQQVETETGRPSGW